MEGRVKAVGNPDLVGWEFRPIVEAINVALDVLSGIIDRIPSPVVTIDKDREILYINDCGAAVIGLKRPDRGNQRLPAVQGRALQHPRVGVRAGHARAVPSPRTTTGPATTNWKISYIGLPIKDDGGQVVRALQFVTDLTAAKKAARVASKVADFQRNRAARSPRTWRSSPPAISSSPWRWPGATPTPRRPGSRSCKSPRPSNRWSRRATYDRRRKISARQPTRENWVPAPRKPATRASTARSSTA